MKLPKKFGGVGFQNVLAEAQQAMAQAQNIEAELANERIDIEKNGVKAQFNGTGELLKVSIDKSLIDPDDIETLEDLLVAAVRDGFTQATEMREARVQAIMPNVPGMDKLGF